MRIAIHSRAGSFSDDWIKYCDEKNIEYRVVDAYSNDILDQLVNYDAFMWHHSHTDYRDKLLAKQLIHALENTNIKVFPNINTCWHFDDKVAQKYLFESVNAPLVKSYVFYDKKQALEWASSTSYPKVFKLKGGAGSSNVKLIKNIGACKSIINKAFNKGFKSQNYSGLAYDKLKMLWKGDAKIYDVAKYIGLWLFPSRFGASLLPKELGYVYFQDFIPNNSTDTRIIVIGDKIIGERRGVRQGDFRASGSNLLLPDHKSVDLKCVQVAYDTAKKLKLQMAVFDFVHDEFNKPKIVEVSYGTSPDYTECEGYWDSNLEFNSSFINLPSIIIESFIAESNA